ncbi:G patch domain-containing protein 11 [Cucurbita argyrosperma subsp. argyrosperma]
MAESAFKQSNEPDDGEEDYMGDLSKLLPPEVTSSSKSMSKKLPANKTPAVQTSIKKPKTFNWQEQRRRDRERKQFEEDEQTLARIEAPIPQSNIGFKLLKQMGYTPGAALGKEGSGLAEPVGLEIRRSRAGIGRQDPIKEKKKQEVIRSERKRNHQEALMEEFGSRQKLQWRSRRIVVNYHKAKAALDQLENKEVVEPEKKDDEEEGDEEEEEEEIITEEDLESILIKLRDEHRYCLFCGYQYDSKELLLSNCPGINEDDH